MNLINKILVWTFVGFIVGICFGSSFVFHVSDPVIHEYNLCKERLQACEDTINNPHACVSIVVETLEGTL